jgi:hypothetical protein
MAPFLVSSTHKIAFDNWTDGFAELVDWMGKPLLVASWKFSQRRRDGISNCVLGQSLPSSIRVQAFPCILDHGMYPSDQWASECIRNPTST